MKEFFKNKFENVLIFLAVFLLMTVMKTLVDFVKNSIKNSKHAKAAELAQRAAHEFEQSHKTKEAFYKKKSPRNGKK